jgi:hypothetical protein
MYDCWRDGVSAVTEVHSVADVPAFVVVLAQI